MLRVLWSLVFVLMFAVVSAAAQSAAQSADQPLMGSEALPPAAPQSAAEPNQIPTAVAPTGFGGEDGVYRILVIGDGLAGGLGNGMARMTASDTRFELANRFNEFASLMRPNNYDWPDAIGKIVSVKPYDAAVVLMGINDRQDWRDGNMRYAFNSPQWIAAYEAQLDRLLDSLKANGMKIYWVAMPPFSEPGFEADMVSIAALQKKHVEAKGGMVLDVRASLLGPDGKYTDRGLDEFGVERRIRESDGITFFKQGNNRFGILVMDALKAAEKLSTPLVTSPAVTEVTPPVTTPPPPQQQTNVQPIAPVDAGTPVFSQQGLDGGEISFDANTVEEQKPVVTAAAATTDGRALIKPVAGSMAEKLIMQGSVIEAPSGRFDDFSYTPPAAAAN